MQFDEIILSCYKKTLDFSGRSNRSEFWYFVLFLFFLYLTDSLFWAAAAWVPRWLSAVILTLYWIFKIIWIGSFIPYLAVQIRRLHDSGRSALWVIGAYASLAIGLLPAYVHDTRSSSEILGFLLLAAGTITWLVVLIFDLLAGDRGVNRFGPVSATSSYR